MSNSQTIAPAPSRRLTLLAGGALLLTTMFWGVMVPLTALLLQYFDPYFLAGARYVVALPFLWLFVLLRRESIAWRALPLARILALGVAMALFSIFYTVGIAHSHPVTAAVVLMSGPIVASILARILYGTRLDRTLMLALPVTVAGGIIVAVGAPSRLQGGMGFGGGEILLVLGQVCWTWYSMRAQQWLAHLGQIVLSTITTSTAGVMMIGLYFILWGFGLAGAPPADVPLDMVVVLVWIAFSGVALSIVLWNFGASTIGVPQAALYLNLQPFIAALTAAALGSPPSLMQIVGGFIVLGAVLYVQISRLRNAA